MVRPSGFLIAKTPTSQSTSGYPMLSEEHKVERIGRGEDILRDEDMLLKVNLIHEHMHSHGQTTHRHRHSHYVFHRH